MELQLVTREQAIKLKKLGFDEPVYQYYTENCYGRRYVLKEIAPYPVNEDPDGNGWVAAPTVALALKWLREVKNLYVTIEVMPLDDDGVSSEIELKLWMPIYKWSARFKMVNGCKNYDEAESSGLYWALDHLLETNKKI